MDVGGEVPRVRIGGHRLDTDAGAEAGAGDVLADRLHVGGGVRGAGLADEDEQRVGVALGDARERLDEHRLRLARLDRSEAEEHLRVIRDSEAAAQLGAGAGRPRSRDVRELDPVRLGDQAVRLRVRQV